MAIAGLSNKAGGKGNAVAHAAYVAREGRYERYTEQGEVLEARAHGNLPSFANDDPAAFWAASDEYERANGTAYRELQIGLPRELNAEQRLSLVKDFVAQEIGGTHAYQFAIHVPKAADGLENPHVHLMFSERRNDGIERGSDQYFKRYNPKFPERGGARKYFGTNPHDRAGRSERKEELKALRDRWEVSCNAALEQAGVDVRISMKSYAERGLDIESEPKQLPSEWRDGGKEMIVALREAKAAELVVRRNPSVIVDRVSAKRSLFTQRDLYCELGKVVDDAEHFSSIKVKIDADPRLVFSPLTKRGADGKQEQLVTTTDVLKTEQSIQALGDVLIEGRGFGLGGSVIGKAIKALPFELSTEQVVAVSQVTDDRRLGLVSGVAGAGKSTMLSVVRDAYEQSGYRVSGMALAGKAADELSKSSGIESRTIASWLYRFDQGDIQLNSKDVLVMDEAGMVHNATMERVLDAANKAGAKVILVGDSEQLQPIDHGTPFLSLSEQHGAVEISQVRRQRVQWQRLATQALSCQQGVAALEQYRKAGCVHEADQDTLIPALVKNSLDGGGAGESDSSIILAHRKVDVAMLNAAVRDERKARGELSDARVVGNSDNKIELSVGDRVVFTKNDKRVGVLNGQFGGVVGLKGDDVSVKRDDGSVVSFSGKAYSDLQHGYASTIHKSQGMTVDRALVWGSASLDRHLAYVAMSRHRDRLDVYQPSEATRVRSLDACLKRSCRPVSVTSLIEQHGLGLTEDASGRQKLELQHATPAQLDKAQAAVSEMKALNKAAQVEQERVFELQQQSDKQHVDKLTAELKALKENEPPDGLLSRVRQSTHDARNEWVRTTRQLISELGDASAALKQDRINWVRAEQYGQNRSGQGLAPHVQEAQSVLKKAAAQQEHQKDERSFYYLNKKLESPLSGIDQRAAQRAQEKVIKDLSLRRDTQALSGDIKQAVVKQQTRSQSHGLSL